jgi:electron transport complex protein RnfD
MTRKGAIIYAIGCGLLTIIFRLYTNMPEGVSYAILLMNTAVPLIDRHTKPKRFGGGAHV